MKFEDKNYFIIDKKKYEDVLKEDQENVYLYHFIYVKYMEANTMNFIKIDDVKDLKHQVSIDEYMYNKNKGKCLAKR